MDSIIVVLRPMDRAVRLGDDLMVRVPNTTTLQQLRRCIYDLKGILSRRQKLSFENGNEIPERMELWTLRRIGLSDYSVVVVSPVRPGMWLWHPLHHYRMQVLDKVLEYLEGKGSFQVELRDVEKAVTIPPVVPDSMLALLRQYPDIIDLYADEFQHKIFVHKASIFVDTEPQRSEEGKMNEEEDTQCPEGAMIPKGVES